MTQSITRDHNCLEPKFPYTPPKVTAVQLYARIKRSSKYYYQGLNPKGKPQLFPVEHIRNDSHAFRLNSNNYRAQDLAFYVRSPGGSFIPLAGGVTK